MSESEIERTKAQLAEIKHAVCASESRGEVRTSNLLNF